MGKTSLSRFDLNRSVFPKIALILEAAITLNRECARMELRQHVKRIENVLSMNI